MVPLTRWVLDGVLAQQSKWRADGLVVPVAVNLSPTTLHNTDFPDQVGDLLRKWGITADHLVFEITESAIMSDVARATETVNRLDRMGVRISIDDFGTGYTSLAYIRKLPVSEIKVDKSFVLNMQESNDDRVIVRSVVDLGHNLGLDVVAEGVEDRATWDMLTQLGCTTAQGYYICRAGRSRGHGRVGPQPGGRVPRDSKATRRRYRQLNPAYDEKNGASGVRAETASATRYACLEHLTPQSKHPGTKPRRRRLPAPSPRIDLGAKRLTPLCTHRYGGAIRERTATHRSARRAGYTVRRRGSRIGGIPDARAYRTPCRTRRTAGVTPDLSLRSAARHEDPTTASPDGCAKRTEDGPSPSLGGSPAVCSP